MLTEPPVDSAPSVPVPNFDKPPPKRVRAYSLGENEYEYQVGPKRVRDRMWVDAADVEEVLRVFATQGVALPIFKEHDEEQGSFGAITLERAEDGGIDQICTWSPEGAALVASGRYLFDSPEIVVAVGEDGRKHLREIRSGSIVNKPARTNSKPLLMSAMVKQAAYLQDARKCLEHIGGLEQSCKGMSAGHANEKLKAALDLLNPVLGPAAAHIQGAIDEMDIDESALDNPLPESQGIKMSTQTTAQPEVLQMSASDRDALKLGAEILKMTGSHNAAEALGKLEGERALVDVLKSEIVKMGAELGIQGFTSDADKFRTYEPQRLIAYMATAPRKAGPVAKEAEAPSADVSRTQVEREMEDRINRSLSRNGIKVGA